MDTPIFDAVCRDLGFPELKVPQRTTTPKVGQKPVRPRRKKRVNA